ncbi:MAG: hypothetical protein A2Y25_09780 [Candidatus Melainabacteria bacterium GWF2_37_15]|nr:MAG: hypothetical protein A2Y25_09780 [Candidatus Melainabacteria bacterium GWF2_37_15]
MTAKAEKIAEELRNSLKEREDFEGLYLYGSQAKGTQHEDSDIDIAGVFIQDVSYDREITLKVYDIDLKHDIVIDFQRVTKEQLIQNPVYFNEIKKGKYYGR